jgi:glycosyltransferase involved in cell wall biosynthesis
MCRLGSFSHKVQTNKNILIISNEIVGTKMAGPGIRYLSFAKVFSKHFKTILFTPTKSDISDKSFKIINFRGKITQAINDHLKPKSIVIAPALPPSAIKLIKKCGARYVADLYDLNLIEVLEYAKDEPGKRREAAFNLNYQTLVKELSLANHILCSNSRQQNFYLGFLASIGRINPPTYQNAPNYSDLISVAPFGLESEDPKSNIHNIYPKKFPAIKPTDKIIYWGGGIWNWFDPLSVVKAIESISKKRDDIKLFFLGVKHPNPKIKKMKAANRAIEYVKKRGLEGKSVFFNYDWTDFEERINFLTQASIGISTHFDNLETHYSFRTRILDYLWAELPMVATRGDFFADLIEEKKLGIVVEPKKPAEIADAIIKLTDDKVFRAITKNNIKKIKPLFYWENILSSLIKRIKEDDFSSPSISNYGISVISLKYWWAKFWKHVVN